ncbi:DsbA family protein [Streptomyces sp. NBC_01465]|uniref:DsbA family protein n=1 Tax=Streptomyces sp. NBC_01465 TaxID=2903878 RepID=UPI002E36F427|nr:thioredoxin domain-containing protein [Streptomyces sp. NBC_01465]
MQFRRAAAGIALTAALATGCTGSPIEESKAGTSSAQLPERLGKDGTTIVVGRTGSTPVQVYEDMRCPVCKDFEDPESGAPVLRRLTKKGLYRTEYTLASFLDDRLGGQGSKRAANALRAALEKRKFAEYHDVLFAHQPEESVDGYTDDFLLRMASLVPGLRDAEFDAAVKNMKYRAFVTASEKAYEKSKASGTPGFAVSGVLVPDEVRGAMFDPQFLPTALQYTALSPADRAKLT